MKTISFSAIAITLMLVLILVGGLNLLAFSLKHEAGTAHLVQMSLGTIWITAMCGVAEYYLVIKRVFIRS